MTVCLYIYPPRSRKELVFPDQTIRGFYQEKVNRLKIISLCIILFSTLLFAKACIMFVVFSYDEAWLYFKSKPALFLLILIFINNTLILAEVVTESAFYCIDYHTYERFLK